IDDLGSKHSEIQLVKFPLVEDLTWDWSRDRDFIDIVLRNSEDALHRVFSAGFQFRDYDAKVYENGWGEIAMYYLVTAKSEWVP
ncbi:MAG: hypothetical protein RTU30_12620, partial [Candidatus Thorarchaeota archaeon]